MAMLRLRELDGLPVCCHIDLLECVDEEEQRQKLAGKRLQNPRSDGHDTRVADLIFMNNAGATRAWSVSFLWILVISRMYL